MKSKKPHFICPRCGYKTIYKLDMKRHFERKKTCQNEHGVELTPNVRAAVLRDHEYRPTKSTKNTLSQTINNYNTINHMVTQINCLDKLKILLDYHDLNIVGFEDMLDTVFQNRSNKLRENSFKCGYFLDENGILKLVDEISKIDKTKMEQFNVMFDRTVRRIKIYDTGKWETMLEDVGSKYIVKLLKSYFLDEYELYLVKNLHRENTKLNRFTVKAHLESYYRFISALGLDPVVADQTDQQIMGYRLVDGQEFLLSNTYTRLYGEQKRKLNKSEFDRTVNKVAQIIRQNTISNLAELNSVVMELVQLDEDFKAEIIDYHKANSTLLGLL